MFAQLEVLTQAAQLLWQSKSSAVDLKLMVKNLFYVQNVMLTKARSHVRSNLQEDRGVEVKSGLFIRRHSRRSATYAHNSNNKTQIMPKHLHHPRVLILVKVVRRSPGGFVIPAGRTFSRCFLVRSTGPSPQWFQHRQGLTILQDS